MQPNIIERVWRQDKMVNVDVLNGFVFTGEVGAHKFVISGKNVNTPVDISGTITANFKNADGVLVPLTGTVEDGKAVVVLSRECYAVEGPFSLMIFADTVCIYAAIANAINSSGEVIAYPTATIPSVQELIEEVQDVIASIPQDYSALSQNVTDLKSAIGNLNNLDTTDKSSVVGAINETYGMFTGAVGDAVADWLDDHPEATTTVQDGSLTEAKFTSTLKLKTVKDYVTPEMYGAVGDGVADDTTAMLSAITYCENNNFALLLTKTYLITSELLTSGISIFGNGHGTLKLNNVNATLHFSQTAPVVGDVSKLFIVEGIIIDCNNVANFGINSDAYRVRYNNINIVNVHFYGIKLTTGYENVFSNIHISASASGTTGIFSMVGDNEFYDISMVDVQTAIHEYRNGGSLYARIHPWIYNPDYLNGSIFFKVSEWTCSILTDCISDTFQTAFWFINGTSSNLQVNGFKHIMNSSITTASGITSDPIYWIYYDTAPSNPVYEMRIRFSQCFASDYILQHGWTFNESNLSEQWAIYDETCNLNFSNRTDCRNIQRTITPSNITASKAQIFLNGSIANIIIEGTPNSSILNTDAQILDLSTAEMSIFFPDDKYRIPVYYSTTNAWTLDGITFGYLQLFTDAGANRHLYLNVKLPSTAKYMVINTNYHVLPTKFR